MNVLQKVRLEKGYSKYRLAKELNIPYTTYSKYERGLIVPRPKRAKKIAQKLGFKWTEFYD